MPIDAPDDYYGLLGVDAAADGAELRRAWRRLAVRWHPDRAGATATTKFQKISAAYQVLSDPSTRAAYDRQRRTTAPSRPDAPAVMLWRLTGHLNSLLACHSARWSEEDVIDLFLRPHEAETGGMVTITMDVPVRCAACTAGSAHACGKCGGKGSVEELYSAWLAVPPQAIDGLLLTPSAQLDGMIRPISFRVRRRPVSA